MTIPYTFEQRAMADVIRAWAAKVDTVAIVRAMENDPNAWRRHWRSFADLGLLSTAEGGLSQLADLDLAVVLSVAGEMLVPGPLLSTVATIIAIDVTIAERGDPLGHLASIRESLVTGVATSGVGTDFQHGLGVALGADEQGLLLATEDGRCFLVQPDGFAASEAIDFSQPTRNVRIEPDAARMSISMSRDELHTLIDVLTTASLSGIARWGSQTMANHAGVRERFGQPMGKFHAVEHMCANAHRASERLAALAWGGMRAISKDLREGAILGAAAVAVGLDDAVRVCQGALQVMGGIGYAFEHDANLYYRRALALRRYVGADRGGTHVAGFAIGSARPRLAPPDHGDILDGAIKEKLVSIALLAASEPRTAVAEHGVVMPALQPPLGLGAHLAERAIEDELVRSGVQRAGLDIANWVEVPR